MAARVQDVMDPEFTVAAITIQRINSCKNRPKIHPPSGKGVSAEEPPISDHDDYMITVIIPAVIISGTFIFI